MQKSSLAACFPLVSLPVIAVVASCILAQQPGLGQRHLLHFQCKTTLFKCLHPRSSSLGPPRSQREEWIGGAGWDGATAEGQQRWVLLPV